MKSLVYLLILPLILTSCAMFENRSYYDIMAETESPMWVPNRDFQVVAGDTGRTYRSYEEISERAPASFEAHQDSQYSYSLRNELMKLENGQSDQDYQVYDRYRHKFASDSEKIYFLRLNPRDRMSYLSAKGFLGNESGFQTNPRAYARAYDQGVWQNSQPRYETPLNQWVPRENSRAPASIEYGGY